MPCRCSIIVGRLQVFSEDWIKLISLGNAVRNVVRVYSILRFAAYHLLWARDLWQPFDMVNMMKFEKAKGSQLYELYRDQAGKLVMANGGHIGYMADIKVPPDSLCTKAGRDEAQL